MSILGLFSQAYGRDVSKYTDVPSRSTILREVLPSKKTLIVLDNASSSEQVEPLLPPTGECAVLVTTRHHNLSIASGLPTFEVGPFNAQRQEALELFTRLLGQERVEAEKSVLLQIAERLGHLPLAVAIAASRLAYELHWSPADLLARLGPGSRLDELVYENRSVNLSLRSTYEMLPPQHQSFFASLGALGSSDFTAEAAGAANGVDVALAMRTLRHFYALSLVDAGRDGRFRLHPLLSDFARREIREPALFMRTAAYFAQYAQEHADDYAALELDLGNILEALEVAHRHGMPELLLSGTHAIYHFLEIRGLYTLALDYLQYARAAAISLGDEAAHAAILLNLGRSSARTGENRQAEMFLLEGLTLARQGGDAEKTCDLLLALASATVNLNRYEEGERHYHEVLLLAREMGFADKTGVALMGLGIIERRQGKYDKAEDHYNQALRVEREAGNTENLIRLLTSLTAIAGLRAQYARADAYLQEGLELAERISDHEATLGLLVNAGCLATSYGDLEMAEAHFSHGLDMARQMCNLGRVSYFLVNLADVLSRQQERNAAAEDYFQEALDLSRQVGEVWILSSTLSSLGEFYLKLNRIDEANACYAETYALAQEHSLAEIGADALFGLARAASARNSHSEAYSLAEKSLAIYHAVSNNHVKQESVESWMASQATVA